MLLEKVAIFILFLGPLVFFHELGHFLFARFFGVGLKFFQLALVQKFSKKNMAKQSMQFRLSLLGDMLKCMAMIPLIKMIFLKLRENIVLLIKENSRVFGLLLVVRLANFVLAFAIFFSLLISGERIPEIKMGAIPSESNLYKSGIRSGDILVKVNETEVYNPTDLMVEGKEEIKSLTD